MQCAPGFLNVLGSGTSENKGMEEHIRDFVLPFQAKYGITAARGRTDAYRRVAAKPRRGFEFRDIGDPSMGFPGMAKSEDTVARIVESMLNTIFEPGPVPWSERREALHAAFQRKGKGDRMFVQVDPEENPTLLKALRGYWRYPKDIHSGRVIYTVEASKRVSGIYAQAADALAYGLAVLYPAESWVRKASTRRAPPTPEPASWLGR